MKLGILHDVHFDGQPEWNDQRRKGRQDEWNPLSHSCLLLFAIMLDPSHTPFPSAPTQLPLNLYWPFPQMTQSFDVAPVQVWQSGEQAWHAEPLLKLPSGHTVPVEVVAWLARHFVLSFAFCVKPVWQVMHVPVWSAQDEHPSWQTEKSISQHSCQLWNVDDVPSQFPSEVRKKPDAHLEHAVPLSPVVHPELHVHWPLD